MGVERHVLEAWHEEGARAGPLQCCGINIVALLMICDYSFTFPCFPSSREGRQVIVDLIVLRLGWPLSHLLSTLHQGCDEERRKD